MARSFESSPSSRHENRVVLQGLTVRLAGRSVVRQAAIPRHDRILFPLVSSSLSSTDPSLPSLLGSPADATRALHEKSLRRATPSSEEAIVRPPHFRRAGIRTMNELVRIIAPT